MKNSLIVCLLSAISVFGSALAVSVSVVKVTTCSSSTIQVRTDVCNGDPCQIKRGSNGVMLIDFTAQSDSDELVASLTIRLGTLDVAFPGFDTNACNSHGIECPVRKGVRYTATYDLNVLPEYPKVKSDIKMIIKDSAGNQDACFSMPLSLVD